MALNILLCLIGFVMLYYGAEWLVKGSSSLAKSLGVTPVVIGLTVVAFGTSAPELVVSLISSIKGKSMIAVGNVVGSNICNIALVLGLAVLFQPIKSHRSVVTRDIPLMLGISLYLLVLSLNSTLGRMEGATLFSGIILYTFFNYHIARKESKTGLNEEAVLSELGIEEVEYIGSRSRQIVFIIVGIVGVVIGCSDCRGIGRRNHANSWRKRKIHWSHNRCLRDLTSRAGHVCCCGNKKRDGYQYR